MFPLLHLSAWPRAIPVMGVQYMHFETVEDGITVKQDVESKS